MTRSRQTAPLISVRTALIAIVVATLSFVSLIVLSAFAPEFEDRNQAGLHAYSKSALGYNFAVSLLEESGATVTINRDPRVLDFPLEDDLLVLTPANRTDANEIAELELGRSGNATLIVLPKRWGTRDPLNSRFHESVALLRDSTVARILHAVSEEGALDRVDPVPEAQMEGVRYPMVISEAMQVLNGPDLLPVISVEGGALLARLAGTDVFILSEPELFNTHGLSHAENADLMVSFMMAIASETGQLRPITIDTTLHGFERGRSLLRAIFEPPLLGATLFAFATAILLGWSAFLRFGRPRPQAPDVATGRQSLINSTTGLFSLTHQEASLADDYGALATRLTVRSLGFPSDQSAERTEEILERRMAVQTRKNPDLPDRPDPSTVSGAASLLAFAQNYHTWKEELSDESD